MVKSARSKVLGIFRNTEGQIVIWQSPNLLLLIWVFCKLLALVVTSDNLESGLSRLGSAALFAWAYLEVRSGVNTFRKALGLVVACSTIRSFFFV